jgi:hypothetical protein
MDQAVERVGRATAMITLVMNGAPNIDIPLVPLARLGPRGMVSELFATLGAMARLASKLAGDAASQSGETPEAVLQRISATVQAELLDPGH